MVSTYLILFSIMGGFSILGSTFLILMYFCTRNVERPAFKRVFWMSICDLLLSLKFWLALITGARVSMEQSKFLCLFSAIFGQFAGIATTSWYFMISVCVYAVFQPPESRWRLFLKSETLQHVYVWSVATFTSLLPWWTGHYGDLDDGTQCWISGAGDLMKLAQGIPLYLHLLFAFYLLAYAVVMSKTTFNFNKRIKEQMFVFVGVFLIVWFWPALALTWDLISPGTLPLALHYMDIGAISGNGFFNFVVWIPDICPCIKEHDISLNSTTEDYEETES